MFPQLKKYKKKGHFFFRSGDTLTELTSDIPNLPGVYYIVKLAAGKIDIVYIGKAGTARTDGSITTEGLQRHLNMEQNGLNRQALFETKIDVESIDALDVYWFVTFDENRQDLPAYVEASILQDYYTVYRRLPNWNKAF